MITQNTNDPKTYVLSIAISEYRYLELLPNATKDSNAIIKVLWDKYKIEKVVTLENKEVTSNRIKEAFNEIKEIIKDNDSLIIFYNGHGAVTGKNDTAYWQFQSSKIDDSNSSYKCTNIIDEIAELEIEHVALFVNSCFSGNIFYQDGLNSPQYDQGGKKSRTLFTSGLKNQSTRDGNGTNGNSPFAEALIDILSNNEDKYELSLLDVISFVCSKFRENDFGSTPRHDTFKGNEGGQFLFYLKEDSGVIWERTLNENTIEGYDKFIQMFPKSLYAEEAKSKKEELVREREEWRCILNENINSTSKFRSEQNSSAIKEQANKALHVLNQLNTNLNTEAYNNSAWDTLMKINNNSTIENSQKILALQEFIKNNSKNNKYISTAIEMLNKIKRRDAAAKLWREINKKRGTLKSIRRGFFEYINQYKYEDNIAEAEERVTDITLYMEVRNLIDESKDLNQGRKLLNKYIQKFPNGFYYQKAKKELDEISIETQSKQIRTDFENAKEDNNLEKIYDLVNHIKGLQDKEIEANKEVLLTAQKFVFDYEQDKNSHYEQAINSDKIHELKLFIEKYSDDSLAADLVTKMETRLYEKDVKFFYEAEEEKTLELYLEYQEIFKLSGNFSTSAVKRIEELVFYESLKTKENYKQYLLEYKERGLMLIEAKKHISDIEFNEKKELSYETAINENSLELCEQYLNEYDEIKDNQWNKIDTLFKRLSFKLEASKLFEEINNAEESKEQLNLCRSYINKYSDEENIKEVNQISQAIQERLDGTAALENAIDAMNLETLDNYKKQHAQNHEIANDYIEYLNAKKAKTEEAFESYIGKYEGGGRNHLRAEDGLKYIEALSLNEIEAFHNYLDSSIEKEFEDDAREKIKELEELKEVKEAYEDALNANTIEQYSNYIRLYGVKNEDFKDVVIEKLSILKKAKQDHAEFEIAKESNDTKLLSAYIGKYGLDGLNGIEATKLLRERGLGITEKDINLAQKVEGTTVAITNLVKQMQAKAEREAKAKVKEDREAKAKAKEEKEVKAQEAKSNASMRLMVIFFMVIVILLFVAIMILLISKVI